MKKYALFTLVAVGSAVISVAAAQTAKIEFPIAELGGCADKAACKAYCDDIDHREACTAFAKAHGLVKQEDVKKYEQLKKAAEAGGPGGCKGEKECRTYCSGQAHAEECWAFAQKAGVTKPRQQGQNQDVRKPPQMPKVIPPQKTDERYLQVSKCLRERYPVSPQQDSRVPMEEFLEYSRRCYEQAGIAPPKPIEQPDDQRDWIGTGRDQNGEIIMPRGFSDFVRACFLKRYSEKDLAGAHVGSFPSKAAKDHFDRCLQEERAPDPTDEIPPTKPMPSRPEPAEIGGGSGPTTSLPSGLTPQQLCAEYGGTWTDHCDFATPPYVPPLSPNQTQGSAWSIFKRLLGY